MLQTIILKTLILDNMCGFHGLYLVFFKFKTMLKILLALRSVFIPVILLSYLMLYGER